MDRPLAGRSILIVEDEPLIAIQLSQVFEHAGARIVTRKTLQAALVAAEDADLSAAIIDHALGDGASTALCERLKERNIPFVTYSGYGDLDGACGAGPHIIKPADPQVLVTTVAGLLASRPISH
jgi:DNA-binding NtrC family response regulator